MRTKRKKDIIDKEKLGTTKTKISVEGVDDWSDK